jgi:hypothetical protein
VEKEGKEGRKKNFVFFFIILFYVFAFTYMCIHYLGHLPPTPPPGRTCSALLFSDFVEEKNIKDNKKNMAFLLV